jgi:putative two-component system response regulator
MNNPAGAFSHPPSEAPCILLVEDDADLRRLWHRLLLREGYRVASATNGREALEQIERVAPDVVLSDVMMHDMDGLELCRRLKAEPRFRLTPVILVTGLDDTQARVRGIEAGADDFIAKPADPQTLRARLKSLTRLKRYTDELERSETVIFALARAIEGRDSHTEGHCERLSELASRLGALLGLTESDVLALRQGGIVHDLGKVVVPDSVLLKQGPLGDDEWEQIRRHPVEGVRIVSGMKSFERVLPIIRHHHERGDGSGYPDGLRGDEIPLLARVLQVVDVYDALISARPYKPAQSKEEALAILDREAQKGWWDRTVVETFRGMMMDDPELGHSNRKNQSGDSASRMAHRSDEREVCVLLVEDDPSFSEVLRRALEGAGISVAIAAHGRDALVRLDSRSQTYDLVITDINMPHMDGIELIGAIADRHLSVPVLAMSGGGLIPKDVLLDNAELLGALDVIEKPFELSAFVRRVGSIVRRDRSRS